MQIHQLISETLNIRWRAVVVRVSSIEHVASTRTLNPKTPMLIDTFVASIACLSLASIPFILIVCGVKKVRVVMAIFMQMLML